MFFLFSNSQLMSQRKWSSFDRQKVHDTTLLDSATFYLKSDPAKAFDFVVKAMDKAIKEKDRSAQGDCYTVIGDINLEVEQFDLAIDNYNKALKIFMALEQEDKIFQLEALLGKAYEANNELEKSETYYKASANTAIKKADNKKIRSSKRNLAKVYQKKGESSKAIQELEEVKQLDISEGDLREQLRTNQQLINAYAANHPQKALDLTTENELLANTSKDTLALLNTLQDRANIYGNIGRADDKINTLQQSIDVRRMQNDLAGQSEDQLAISEELMAQNKVNDAINYLEQSIELSERTGKIDTRKKALKTLSTAYDESGNINQAYTAYKAYIEASEKSAAAREKQILANLELMQSMASRLQRIDMLENQQLLNDKTIELLRQESEINEKSMRQQRLIITSLMIGIFILVFATYLVYRSSQQKRLANQLLALRSLRSQMNPHFIFNALNSVNNYISKSDERSANKYLTDFSKLMRAVMENSKHDFVSLASEIQILELYLRLEHHRFKDKFNYSFTVDPEIDQENIQIPPMLVQPYIENAVWHGLRYKEAKGYLKVSLKNGDHLKVIIEDNGIGRRKSIKLKTKNQQSANSTGLKNINNRLGIINQIHKTNLQVAIEDVNDSEEPGTRVTIDIIQHR
jgi:tetratricopeptide (TPR) repeat protein